MRNLEKSDKKNKLKQKQKGQNEISNQKKFIEEEMCLSDSENSIIDTVTQVSSNRLGKRINFDEDFENKSPKQKRKLRNSVISPEKFDMKKHLTELNIIETKKENENFNSNLLKKNNLKDSFLYEEFEEYPYDHSLIKQIEFDVEMNMENFEDFILNENKDFNLKETFRKEKSYDFLAIKNLIMNFLKEKILFYYEFRNFNEKEGNPESFDIKSINNLENSDIKYTSIKENSYLEALNYIFCKISEKFKKEKKNSSQKESNFLNNSDKLLFNENKFFYICLPLYSCYFFNNLESDLWKNKNNDINERGVLLSNLSKNLEKKLNDSDIDFQKINAELTRFETLQRKKTSEKTFKSGMNYLNDYASFIQGNDNESNESCILYIKNFHQNIFFNEFLNSYGESYFKIFSPLAFANSSCKNNNFLVEIVKTPEKTSLKIKIIGCVFQNYLKNIIGYLKEISTSFNFSIVHFYKTPSFHLMNKLLKNPIDFCKYENKKFYVRLKKNQK